MDYPNDPIKGWDHYRRTLRLDPIADNDPLPDDFRDCKGTRSLCIVEGDVVEVRCCRTFEIIDTYTAELPEKVAA